MRQEFDDCLVSWRKALMIREAHLGSRHDATKETHDLIRTVLSRMGLSDRECKQYLKLLKKSVRHEAQGDAHAADGSDKHRRKAFREYHKALKLEETLVGMDHHMITATLHQKIASLTTQSTVAESAWLSWTSGMSSSSSSSSSSFSLPSSISSSVSLSSASTSSKKKSWKNSSDDHLFSSLSLSSSSSSDTSILLFCDTLASDSQ